MADRAPRPRGALPSPTRVLGFFRPVLTPTSGTGRRAPSSIETGEPHRLGSEWPLVDSPVMASPRPRRGVGSSLPVAKIGDVAAAAGVSAATVSRVLNGRGNVSSELSDRVRQVAEELDYQPFGPARALRQQTTPVWAVIIADIENPFFTAMVRGVED